MSTKLNVDITSLFSALKSIEPFLGKIDGVPLTTYMTGNKTSTTTIYYNLRLETCGGFLVLLAANYEVYVQQVIRLSGLVISEPCMVTIPFKTLLDWLSSFRTEGQSVEMTVDEKLSTVVVKYMRHQCTIKGRPDFMPQPKIEELGPIEYDSSLKMGAVFVSLFTARLDKNWHSWDTVFFLPDGETSVMFGYDVATLIAYKLPIKLPRSFALGARYFNAVLDMFNLYPQGDKKNIKIQICTNGIMIKQEIDKSLIPREAYILFCDRPVPDIRSILNAEYAFCVTLDLQEFKKCCQRCMIPGNDSLVHVDLNKKIMGVVAEEISTLSFLGSMSSLVEPFPSDDLCLRIDYLWDFISLFSAHMPKKVYFVANGQHQAVRMVYEDHPDLSMTIMPLQMENQQFPGELSLLQGGLKEHVE